MSARACPRATTLAFASPAALTFAVFIAGVPYPKKTEDANY